MINKFKLDDIISIDETSVSTSLTHNYCRAFLGDRCVKKTTNNEVFKKYSLVVAIDNKECIASELYDKGAVNADRFNGFLTKICNKVKGKLFVLDNGQIHKKESTKHIIIDTSGLINLFCPEKDKDGNKVKKGELLSNVKENQNEVWCNFLNLKNKIFKNKHYQFHNQFQTDGISCCLLFIRKDLKDKKWGSRVPVLQEQDFYNIEDLSKEQLDKISL